jgi:hypothetical protein
MAGEKGDAIWPTINAAQTYVEVVLPDLILDALNDAIPAPLTKAEQCEVCAGDDRLE